MGLFLGAHTFEKGHKDVISDHKWVTYNNEK